MKIIIIIESDNNAAKMAKKTLAWASRSGYDIRVFIPDESQLLDYIAAIKDLNYQEFVDVDIGILKYGDVTPVDYARVFNYDLVLHLPDNMPYWRRSKDRDKMIIQFAEQVGSARKKLSHNPTRKKIKFDNGAVLERV